VKIRSDTRLLHLPIIAMTAHATMEERHRCLIAGMNDHVSKPIDPALLFVTLARYCKRRLAPRKDETIPAASKIAAASSSEVPSIDGLDTVDGLRRVAGNKRLYIKILQHRSQAPWRRMMSGLPNGSPTRSRVSREASGRPRSRKQRETFKKPSRHEYRRRS